MTGRDTLTVRLASEADLDDIEEMINDFVKGHPAERHPRARSALRDAYFGASPVANLVVAVRDGRAIGMGQWTLIYDMFWSMYGANAEWLYVRPEYRGRGVVVAIVSEICAQVRRAGGEFLHGEAVTQWSAYTNAWPSASPRMSVTFRPKPFRFLRTWLVLRRGRSFAGCLIRS